MAEIGGQQLYRRFHVTIPEQDSVTILHGLRILGRALTAAEAAQIMVRKLPDGEDSISGGNDWAVVVISGEPTPTSVTLLNTSGSGGDPPVIGVTAIINVEIALPHTLTGNPGGVADYQP